MTPNVCFIGHYHCCKVVILDFYYMFIMFSTYALFEWFQYLYPVLFFMTLSEDYSVLFYGMFSQILHLSFSVCWFLFQLPKVLGVNAVDRVLLDAPCSGTGVSNWGECVTIYLALLASFFHNCLMKPNESWLQVISKDESVKTSKSSDEIHKCAHLQKVDCSFCWYF